MAPAPQPGPSRVRSQGARGVLSRVETRSTIARKPGDGRPGDGHVSVRLGKVAAVDHSASPPASFDKAAAITLSRSFAACW